MAVTWKKLAYEDDVVTKALFDAHTILYATSDNTPAALTVTEQTVVGRITSGNIAALSVAQLQALVLSTALPENSSLIFDAALSADGKYQGWVTSGYAAGATLAFGDIVYLQTADSRWELAGADNEAVGCNFLLGICVLAAAGDGSATTVLLYGMVRADTAFPAITIGAPVYLGTTAGDIVTTAPSGTTDVVRVVGHGLDANSILFKPDNDWITLA